MKTDIAWFNFTSGELSPRMNGRLDFDKYYNGAEALLNLVVQPQGGVTRRPGTGFVAAASSAAIPSRLIPFVFSTKQPYVIELNNGTARFYANGGQVLSGGSPVQLATPYAAADLAAIGYTQSADTLYLMHAAYPPQTLTRTGAAAFSIGPLVLRDGPYLNQNTSATELNVSALTGTVTVSASAPDGINNGLGFLASDAGRHLRIRLASSWAWYIINSVSDILHCVATLQAPCGNGAFMPDGVPWAPNTIYPTGAVVANGGNYYICMVSGYSATGGGGPSGTGSTIIDATVTWAWTYAPPPWTPTFMLGKYSPGNYPALCMFWQNRLMLAGCPNAPNSVDASVIGDFTNFAPTQSDGSVTAVNGLNWTISDDQVNAIAWLAPAGSAQTMQLGIGTSGGEDILQPGSQSTAMSPTNVQAYRETSFGCAPILPKRIAKSLLFVNRSGLKLHEWTFQWQVNGYVGPDIAVLAEHLLPPGLAEIAWQQSPHGVLWCRRTDNQLVAMTYLRDQNVVGWHRHRLGGSYYGGPPLVESLCVIPTAGAAPDELWLAVCRTVGGVPFRSIEVLQPYFQNSPVEAGWFVDCGIASVLNTPAASLTIAGLTDSAAEGDAVALTGTAVLVASAAAFTAAGQVLRVNGGLISISAVADSEHATGVVTTQAPLTSMAPAAAGAWTLDTPKTVFSGMLPWAGETFDVLADGMDQGPMTVSAAGTITLAAPATRVLAGYGNVSKVVTMPSEPGRGNGAPAAGKVKRLDTVYLRFFETVAGAAGQRLQDAASQQITEMVEALPARWLGDPMGQAPRLFTGVARLKPRGGSDPEGRLIVRQNRPLPLTLLAISGRMDIEEVSPQ